GQSDTVGPSQIVVVEARPDAAEVVADEALVHTTAQLLTERQHALEVLARSRLVFCIGIFDAASPRRTQVPEVVDALRSARVPELRTAITDLLGTNVRVLDERIEELDRKSTRLNSSHVKTSYAVF